MEEQFRDDSSKPLFRQAFYTLHVLGVSIVAAKELLLRKSVYRSESIARDRMHTFFNAGMENL